MLLRATAWGCVVLFAGMAAGQQADYALVAVEATSNVTVAQQDAFYQGLVEKLQTFRQIKLTERKQLKTVLDQRDLAMALDSDGGNKTYASAAGKGDKVLVPALCRVEDDYILSLRVVSVKNAATLAVAVRKTRVISQFAVVSLELATEVLGDPANVPIEPAAAMSKAAIDTLRAQCKRARADKFFPALWERAEKIYEDPSPKISLPQLAQYYAGLLLLSAQASAPPPGMVFVPGGWAVVETAAGPRKLWSEPFFLDRYEVSVGQYVQFLAAASTDPRARTYLSITRGSPQFNDLSLPVTGITWHAAAAYAQWSGKRLPTALQWLRAAAGDDNRGFPCGAEPDLARCNLKGGADGFVILAPVAAPGKDMGPFGVEGLTGNVREWTATWYDKQLYARTKAEAPEDPAEGVTKVVKGGSWRTGPREAACQYLENVKPGEAADDLGFRCALPFFFTPMAETPPVKPGT